MVTKALKGIYALILGFLVWDRSTIVLTQLSEMPAPRIPDLVSAVLATAFFAGYVAFLVTRNRMLLGLSFAVYSVYALRTILQTFSHPILSEQEYIAAIAFYFVLGLPMLVALVANFKHNKSSKSDAEKRAVS
ncbi:hypothetical protein [Agarivorans albus]|uniref:hypothetical protein n=1 Tax=Agarivorans albus TaxID=182262 RepID=UPI00058E286A|nr:hypothetical protein [Agarivorans albus]